MNGGTHGVKCLICKNIYIIAIIYKKINIIIIYIKGRHIIAIGIY